MEDLWIKDIDQDGWGEAIVVTKGTSSTIYTNLLNRVHVYSLNGSTKWEYGLEETIFEAKIWDINNDNMDEILISSGERLNKITRGKVRTISPYGKIMRILDSGPMASSIFITFEIGDIENDRYYEISGGSEKRGYLIRNYGEQIWEFPARDAGTLNKSIQSIEFADINLNGYYELIFGSDRIYIIDKDGASMAEIIIEENLDPKKRGIKFITSTKLSANKFPDLLAITEANNVISVNIKEILGQHPNWKIKHEIDWVRNFQCNILDWAIENIDSDDNMELIFSCSNNRLYAIDNNGLTIWDYPLDGEPTDFKLEDMNGDGKNDILAVTNAGSIYLISTSGEFMWKHETDTPLVAVAAGYMDVDETKEIITVTESSKAIAYAINESYNLARKGDTLFNLGQQKFIETNYDDAKEYFEQSKTIYDLLNNQRGVIEAEKFIDKTIIELRKKRKGQADILLARAREYYIHEELTNAESFAQKAMELYREYNNPEGILDCEILLLKIEKQKEMYRLTTSTIYDSSITTTTIAVLSEDETNVVYYFGGAFVIFVIFGMLIKGKKKKQDTNIDESIEELADLWEQEFEDE